MTAVPSEKSASICQMTGRKVTQTCVVKEESVSGNNLMRQIYVLIYEVG
jgi:hypothetical protein